MELKTTYFEKPGQDNSEETLQIAKQRADELGIKKVVIASTYGNTAARAVEVFQGIKVIAVSHSFGFMKPGILTFTDENRKAVESKGGTVLTATHIFAGLSRAMSTQFNTAVIGDIVANTLRVLGQGMKVVCEIAMMAADAGLVPTNEDVIVIGGTGKGADTAVVLTPVNSQNFFAMKVKEILCKPHF